MFSGQYKCFYEINELFSDIANSIDVLVPFALIMMSRLNTVPHVVPVIFNNFGTKLTFVEHHSNNR